MKNKPDSDSGSIKNIVYNYPFTHKRLNSPLVSKKLHDKEVLLLMSASLLRQVMHAILKVIAPFSLLKDIYV